MPKVTTITCDTCGKDVTYTSYASEYYLALSNVSKINDGNGCYAMELSPECKDSVFCGLKCLKEWVNTLVK